VRRVDEIPQNRFLFDDVRVMLHVRHARHTIGERREIRRTAGGFEFPEAMQFFRQRDEVNGLLRFAERDHLHEDAAMLIEKKIFGAQVFDCGIQRVVVEQNRTEDGALGFEIIWKGAFEMRVCGHGTWRISLYLRPR
jgi:hypothetical protein